MFWVSFKRSNFFFNVEWVYGFGVSFDPSIFSLCLINMVPVSFKQNILVPFTLINMFFESETEIFCSVTLSVCLSNKYMFWVFLSQVFRSLCLYACQFLVRFIFTYRFSYIFEIHFALLLLECAKMFISPVIVCCVSCYIWLYVGYTLCYMLCYCHATDIFLIFRESE